VNPNLKILEEIYMYICVTFSR